MHSLILLHIYCVPGTVLDANKNQLPQLFTKLLRRDPGRPRWMGFWAHSCLCRNIRLPILFGGGDGDDSMLERTMRAPSSWHPGRLSHLLYRLHALGQAILQVSFRVFFSCIHLLWRLSKRLSLQCQSTFRLISFLAYNHYGDTCSPQLALSYTRKRINISCVNEVALAQSTVLLPVFPIGGTTWMTGW